MTRAERLEQQQQQHPLPRHNIYSINKQSSCSMFSPVHGSNQRRLLVSLVARQRWSPAPPFVMQPCPPPQAARALSHLCCRTNPSMDTGTENSSIWNRSIIVNPCSRSLVRFPTRLHKNKQFFASMTESELKKRRMDEFQDLFVEARLCIEDVNESAGTQYFDEDAQAAREAVQEVLDAFEKILASTPDANEKNRILRGNGLKVEQLKGELEMAMKAEH